MRILLPIDSDEDRAIAAAETVTSLPNAAEAVHVTIVNVQRRVEVSGDGDRVDSDDWFDEEEYPPAVDEAIRVLEGAGITVEKRREHDDPGDAIVEVADDIDADRIIMAGRKRSPVGKVLFGSVAQDVLLNSKTPVTFIAV